MRRTRARGLPLFLLLLLAVYVLLPFFGSAWHNAAPEHEHFYLGAGPLQDGSTASSELNAAAVAIARLNQISGPTVVHAFNPAAALQVLAIVVALAALILIVPACGRWQRLPARSLFLAFPLLLPLDPPPVA